MYIGETIMAGANVLSPWFPRQDDNAVFTWEEVQKTGNASLTVTIWHKNRLAYYRKTFGLVGSSLARLMTAVRGLQELQNLRALDAPKEARRAVWQSVREVWAA